MNAPRLAPPFVLFALLAAPAVAEKVWVVDQAMGAGAHFSSVTAAIGAAAAGDVVLVRAGNYGHLDIIGKAVSVVADVGALVRFAEGAHILDVPAGPPVVLRGCEFGYWSDPRLGGFIGAGVEVARCDASVWVESCTIEKGWPGLVVADCDEVVLVGIHATGGHGLVGFVPSFDPGVALEVVRSSVVVHEPDLVGGPGADGSIGLPAFGGWAAAAGVRVEDATVHFTGGSVVGGKGGTGAADPFGCLPPGAGAPGLVLAPSGTPNHVTLLGVAVTGGDNGDPAASCPRLLDPVPRYVIEGGTLALLEGTPAVLTAPATAREGTTLPLSLTAAAEPGQFAVLLLSPAQATLDLLTLGTLVVAQPFAIPLGPLAPDGTLAVAPLVPPIPAAEGLRMHLQALTCKASSCLIGTATHVVLLDAAL